MEAVTVKVLEALAKAPASEQRAKFFAELGKVEKGGPAWHELKLYARPAFAPGPYEHHEWLALTVMQEPTPRLVTAEERAREARIAEAYDAMKAAQDKWLAACRRLNALEGQEPGNNLFGQPREHGADHHAALEAAREAEITARELFDEAGDAWRRAQRPERRAPEPRRGSIIGGALAGLRH